MAMAVKSSLVYSGLGIQSPECWSSAGWEHDSLTTDSWEWEDPNTNYATRQGHSSEWASVTVASSAGATKSGEFSPLYTLGTSATSVSSGIPGAARGSDSASFVKHEPNENGVAVPAIRSGPNESCFFRSLSRDSEDGSAEEAQGGQKSNGSTGSAGSADGENMGLKLGRRTYLEDSAAKAGSFALSPPGKKQRPLSPSTHVPRCQVEGCKADLSGCKDYHKRHKVCEMHSKAPKAISNGIEQRFCQQCSRFHILKEFDEGKRSCRRRLAGHNERRRKPHPETHSLFGLGNPFLHREISTSTMGGAPFYYPDMKPSGILHPHRSSLLDYGLHSYGQSLNLTDTWSMKSRNDTIPTFHIQDSKSPMTTLKPTPSLNLGGHHHFLEGSMGSLGQGLSLSSSTGGMLGNMEQQHHQQQQQQQQQQQSHSAQSLSNVSGMIDSGRALSLLSSQSWALLRPPLTTTTSAQQQAPPSGLSRAGDSTLEQLVASSKESNSRGVSRFSHHHACEGPSTSVQFGNKPFAMPSVDTGGLNFGLTATGTGIHDRGICNNSNNNNTNHNINSNSNSNSMLAALGGGYGETNSMLGLVQNGQDLAGFGSSHQAGATTMDLMQTVHSHDVHAQVYSSGFHSFDSSRFSDQQQLL